MRLGFGRGEEGGGDILLTERECGFIGGEGRGDGVGMVEWEDILPLSWCVDIKQKEGGNNICTCRERRGVGRYVSRVEGGLKKIGVNDRGVFVGFVIHSHTWV